MREVLRGRFRDLMDCAHNQKILVPIPVALTCLDVDKMDKSAARKAYTSYIGPLRKGDHKSGSVVKLREALKRAIIQPRAMTDLSSC